MMLASEMVGADERLAKQIAGAREQRCSRDLTTNRKRGDMGYVHHRTSRKLSLALLTALSLLSLIVAALPTKASAAPGGEYAAFAECPTADIELAGCFLARTESGAIKIGNQSVPIENPQIFQGGFVEEESGALKVVGAANGNTFPPSPQTVPGGLLGVLCEALPGLAKALCNAAFRAGLTEVKATPELAEPPSAIELSEINLFAESGTGLRLPIKVKLENTFLGNKCYVGSNTDPIVLNLTTGATSPPPPNESIHGQLGTLNSRAEGRILVDEENSLVDNSFAAPAATGCGGLLASVVDPVLNSVLGLPAEAGHNAARLNGTLEQTGVEAARESE
jgi:hypothetical protein